MWGDVKYILCGDEEGGGKMGLVCRRGREVGDCGHGLYRLPLTKEDKTINKLTQPFHQPRLSNSPTQQTQTLPPPSIYFQTNALRV